MSNFEEDASAAYLKKVKSNHFAFYNTMNNQPYNTSSESKKQEEKQKSSSNINNNDNTKKKKSVVQEAMSLLYNFSAPSLPRNYLPSQESTLEIASNFDKLRHQLLEIRVELMKCIAAAGAGEDEEVEEQTRKKSGTRRQRKEEDSEHNSPSSSSSTIVARIARQIYTSKAGEELVQKCIPKGYTGDEKKRWNNVVFDANISPLHFGSSEIEKFLLEGNSSDESLTLPYSSSYLTFTPNVTVSFLARLTPGLSNFLVETICRKFSTLASSKENIKVELSSTSSLELVVEASAECLEQQNSSSLSSPRPPTPSNSFGVGSSPSVRANTISSSNHQQQELLQIEGLVRSIALLRHSQVGCWLYCALCGIEFPLSIEVSRSLQQILRICCKSLKSLFDLRPDIKDVIVDEKSDEGSNAKSSADLILTKLNNVGDVESLSLPAPAVDGASTSEQTENKKQDQDVTGTNHQRKYQAKIVVKGVEFFTVEDARALLTLITVIGKSFKQSNPALLPL